MPTNDPTNPESGDSQQLARLGGAIEDVEFHVTNTIAAFRNGDWFLGIEELLKAHDAIENLQDRHRPHQEYLRGLGKRLERELEDDDGE
jgi:hypothetical protein